MRKGTKHLRLASLIQIVLGALSICLTYFLIGEYDESNIGVSA